MAFAGWESALLYLIYSIYLFVVSVSAQKEKKKVDAVLSEGINGCTNEEALLEGSWLKANKNEDKNK